MALYPPRFLQIYCYPSGNNIMLIDHKTGPVISCGLQTYSYILRFIPVR